MISRITGVRAAGLCLTAAIVFAPAAGRAAEQQGDFQKLLADKAPSLVTIKFVLKIQMGGRMRTMGNQESENEVTGVMIDPKGLVLCSNTQLGGFTGLMKRFMGSMAKDMSSKPTDLKVLSGDDTEGLEAEFLARDTDLDLAWVQIKKPGDRTFAYVDLAKDAKPKIGDRLLAVRRMGKHFDRVAVVAESRVGGIAKKPRDLFIPAGEFSEAMGLPVFTVSGAVVGIVAMQMEDEEAGSENPMSVLSRMSSIKDMAAGSILPAAEVIKATARAKETAATRPAETEEAEETKEPPKARPSAKPVEPKSPKQPQPPAKPGESSE